MSAEPIIDTVHVAVRWNDETDEPYVYAVPPGDTDEDPRAFEGEVPSEMYQRMVAAWDAGRVAEREIVDLLGIDPESGRLKVCCPKWVGDVRPEYVHYSIFLEASGRLDVWPITDAHIMFEKTEAEALAVIDALPDEFFVHYGAGATLAHVTKDRLFVRRSGLRASSSACYRCGWERGEHGAKPGPENA